MIDRHSTTWLEVQAWARGRHTAAMQRLKATGAGLAETEHLRGRIAELEDLLALAAEPEVKPIVDGGGYDFQAPDEA